MVCSVWLCFTGRECVFTKFVCFVQTAEIAKEKLMLLVKLLPEWCHTVDIPSFSGKKKIDIKYFVLKNRKYQRKDVAKALQAAKESFTAAL